MHSSVLQNKKYIDFADENTVEVISLSRLEEGIEKQDRRAATYLEKDAEGNEVEYLVEFPGLTAEDMIALNRSPAGQYNKTGRIPYTAIVDPHTLQEIKNWPGSTSSGAIMEAVEQARKQLNKDHPKGPSRKSLLAIEDGAAEIRGLLQEGEFADALKEAKKLAKYGEDHELLADKVAKVEEMIFARGGQLVDELEKDIGGEEHDSAVRELKKLARAFKRTELEDRIDGILSQAAGQ